MRTFRCSNLDRVLTCNGSIALEPLVAPRVGDDGDEGTRLHAYAADRIAKELGGVWDDAPTNEPPPYDSGKWVADFYVRHVRDTVPGNWSLGLEVAFEHEFDCFCLTGHADCVAISPDATEAIGFDLKTGYVAVDHAEFNEQLLGYVVELKLAYPSLKKIRFDIVQPRNSEEDGLERVSTVTLDGARLEAAPAVLESRINAAINNSGELNSGIKQCRFCPAAIQCPAKREEQKIMKMKLTKEALAAMKREPDDATLADWVITARSLAQATKDAEALLHERLDATGCVVAGDGTTVTRKVRRGSYEVQRPVEFLAAFRAIIPGEESLAKCFNPSMTRIKDEIAEKMSVPKTGMASVTAESVFDAHLRPHVKQGESRVLVFG